VLATAARSRHTAWRRRCVGDVLRECLAFAGHTEELLPHRVAAWLGRVSPAG
jgi:hypothetical protein